MSRFRSHLSYANVMATVAVFAAFGGTSYAVSQLPRNSVGAKQIRSGAVGKSELARSAVRSKHIKNRSIAVEDISRAARSSLRGRQGPPGPAGSAGPSAATYGVIARSDGSYQRSVGAANAGAAHRSGTGDYELLFNSDVSNCLAAATIAGVDGVQPQSGQLVATISGSYVTVRTRNATGNPADLPFHLIVSC